MKFGRLGFNQWKNPDHGVRLAYAQRSGNEKKLLHLALFDVYESVRVAAVKNLKTDTSRVEVIVGSSCERSLQLALGLIESDETRCQVASMADLDEDIRLKAITEAKKKDDDLLLQLAVDPADRIAVYAIEQARDVRGLEAIYSEAYSDDRCLAIIKKSTNESLAQQIFEVSEVNERRLAALINISDQKKLSRYYFEEHDPEMRSAIIDQYEDHSDLINLFEDEDDERLRAKIASCARNSEWLVDVANNDYNINVRRAAVGAIDQPTMLVKVALLNEDRNIHELVFRGDLDDDLLVDLALNAASSYVRVEAVNRIQHDSSLKRLMNGAESADTLWFVARRLGFLPIEYLRKIEATEALVRVAEQDAQKIVRIAAMRQIKEKWALEQLTKSSNQDVADLAISLEYEVKTPVGLSFLKVPDRIYQMSVFPVTGEQFALWKRELGDADAANRYQALRDLPVTDVTVDEAADYCNWLGTLDHGRYRLPYFHEWKHATICDAPDWFSTGRLRAFANKEEAELVLFGNTKSSRPMHEAIPNPWGFLDTVGNVLEWTCDPIYSEQMLTGGISLDEFAQLKRTGSAELPDLAGFAYASGNHWGDPRIRTGRWKRLIHRNKLSDSAAGKVGFRVIRFDPTAPIEPIEYELTLLPDVAFGYTLDQVAWGLSRSLSIDFEEVKKRFVVAPHRLDIMRDYGAILRVKELWESHGARTELLSKPVRANGDA